MNKPDAELQARLDSHLEWCRNPLSGDCFEAKPNESFAGLDLEGVSFYCTKLIGVSFEGANLKKAFFFMADLKEANLKNADLSEAVLDYASLNGADVTGANFSGASYEHIEIERDAFLNGTFSDKPEQPRQKSNGLKAVQFTPQYCEAAKGTRFEDWDSTHDLSILDENGGRHRIGSMRTAGLATEVGKLIEKHGDPAVFCSEGDKEREANLAEMDKEISGVDEEGER